MSKLIVNKFSLLTITSIIILSKYYSLSYAQEKMNLVDAKPNSFLPGEDSYRMTFELKNPRRYATRYDKETRTIQLRIIPARAEEFKETSYYDSRLIKRLVIQEINSEVVINIQIKNVPVGWVVATQNNPWRIFVDLWKTEAEDINKNNDWNWQPNFIAGYSEDFNNLSPLKNNEKNQSNYASKEPLNKENKKVVEKLVNDTSEKTNYVTTVNKNYEIPDIYGRIEVYVALSREMEDELRLKMGSVIGSSKEFESGKILAQNLYKKGEEERALNIFRRLAALSEVRFKSDPEMLWYAGESAYLTKNFDIANDYFQTILVNFPGNQFLSYAKLRLIDIDKITNEKVQSSKENNITNSQKYSELALDEKNPQIIRAAATLRVLDGVIDKNPEAAKLYQQNLDGCVTLKTVAFDMLKNCAYDKVRAIVEQDNINVSDGAVQQFKKFAPKDLRAQGLELIVQNRVKDFIKQVAQTKKWEEWVNFEKNARVSLLQFTFGDPDSLYIRAEAFEAVGDNAKAIQLYGAFLKSSSDDKRKSEAAAIAARLLYMSNKVTDADNFLRKIEQNEKRKTDGLTDKTLQTLRMISVEPYRDKLALSLLIYEMKLGRYVERELPTLSEWAAQLQGTPNAEPLYEKILAFPAKSADEIQIVEKSIMKFADDLRDQGSFSRSGDMYLAMANLAQGSRRAEAAYKAGVVYARAGLFDKAKTAWLLAANDTNDKRYSSLANERLDRINK